jgi:hypothetical protein
MSDPSSNLYGFDAIGVPVQDRQIEAIAQKWVMLRGKVLLNRRQVSREGLSIGPASTDVDRSEKRSHPGRASMEQHFVFTSLCTNVRLKLLQLHPMPPDPLLG